jgi:hypothetical protein
VKIYLRKGFIDSRLVGPKGAAALQQQGDALERRTVSRASDPVWHNFLHGV